MHYCQRLCHRRLCSFAFLKAQLSELLFASSTFLSLPSWILFGQFPSAFDLFQREPLQIGLLLVLQEREWPQITGSERLQSLLQAGRQRIATGLVKEVLVFYLLAWQVIFC